MEKKFTLTFVTLFCAVTAWVHAETPLESALLDAVRAEHFERVVDFGAGNESRPVKAQLGLPAKQIAHPPNINVAVIQLDADGRMVDRACVLLSRDYPNGLVVPLDKNAGASSVRFLRWDIERSDGGTFAREDGHQLTTKGWTNNPPLTEADDVMPGRTSAPYQFMAPYPASLFKILVAFHVMRMVDAGRLTFDTEYIYAVTNAKPEPRKIRDWLEPMITVSDNHATSALLKMLHDQNEIEPLNREFRELNLGTLQINATSPKDGRGWSPGQIHLTAFDVARLFWIIDGGAGEFWQGADGKPVTAKLLSEASRAFLKKLLSEQAFNDALTTANFPGAKNVRPGIPSRVAGRWINPTNGHVIVDGEDFGVDIRAANAQAEVNFAHKTGLTFNYGSDAGIVTSLPGQPFRHYVIAFLGNLGHRYADEVFAARTNFPAFDKTGPIVYSQRIPALGKAIDDALIKLSACNARLEVFTLNSRALKNNPLHDPSSRPVPVFLPAQATNGARLPVIYYLPGYGNSADKFIASSNVWLKFTQQIADEITPMILVVCDGKTRWGGSQYLNSAAQGNYADFVCDEIVKTVENKFPAPAGGVRRIIGGHSSGGFGALRLGSDRQKLFDAVIALSPDSDFPTSHLPLVKVAAVASLPLADVKKIAAAALPVPKNGDITYALGLSAAYAPRGFFHRGEFEWLYDARGNFREQVWQRWLDNDPLTVVQKNPRAFSPAQQIYLEGAAQDQFAANVGARKIYEVLQPRPARCTFYEPPGHHSDHVRERLQRGLEWVFNRPLTDIQ